MNDPVLFINSVNDKKEGKENQDYFDSRVNSNKKKLLEHRLEDIKAMSFFKMNIYVIVITKDNMYEGVLNSIDDEIIYLNSKENVKKILIKDIEEIFVKKR